ncbi:MAG: hypothetical protein ABSH20_14485 [Tepidisphaeraceae bacterium]|jgi:hypothetical protein
MTTRLPAIVFGAALMTWLISGTCEAAARRAPKSAQETVQEQCDLMVQECKLTEEQQKTIKEKFKVKQAALEAWDKANAEKVTAAEEAAKTARAGTDAAAKKTANDNLKALMDERAQATAEADKAILAVLTEPQKATWAGAELAQTTLPRYKKANLTDEQTAKIKAACAIAAKDLAGFTGDDRKDKQGRTTVQKCLKWAIDNVILTPEQRDVVVKPVPQPPEPPK